MLLFVLIIGTLFWVLRERLWYPSVSLLVARLFDLSNEIWLAGVLLVSREVLNWVHDWLTACEVDIGLSFTVLLWISFSCFFFLFVKFCLWMVLVLKAKKDIVLVAVLLTVYLCYFLCSLVLELCVSWVFVSFLKITIKGNF